jgi:chorismate lyase / 3-hydroxybenzoate synthase
MRSLAAVNAPVLGDTTTLREVWKVSDPIDSGTQGIVRYTRTANVLFGSMSIPGDLYQATERAYRQMLDTLDALRYPHLVRVWNYIPDINKEVDGTERYKQFNAARLAALQSHGRPVTGNVSAACALGAPAGGPLVVHFLASKNAPSFIENPRQISAYNYPPQYGVRPPVFSRAAVLHEPDKMTLFISGTSSIVGHQTLHVGDPAAQTRETIINLKAVLSEANRVTRSDEFTLESLSCRVYVRDPSDLPAIQAELRSALGPSARPVYLQADICRHDLSVEIEATAAVGV